MGHIGSVRLVASIPNTDYIVSECNDALTIWNYTSGQCLSNLTVHKFLTAVSWIQNTDTIVSGSVDGTIKIWNYKAGQILRNITGHSEMVSSVIAIPNTDYIISGSWDKTIKI